MLRYSDEKLQGLNPFDTDNELGRLDKQTQNTNLIIWNIRYMKHINQSQKSRKTLCIKEKEALKEP